MKLAPALLSPLALLTLCAAVAVPAQAANPKPGAPAPCGCDDLRKIEDDLQDQEYLGELFSQWAGHVPDGMDHSKIQSQGADFLQLAFYGAKSQAPRIVHGAHADLGTLIQTEGCPIVLYHYKDGRPVMTRDPSQGTVTKGEKIKLVHKTSPVDEASYPANGQCAALVHYGFAHEQHHQNICNALFKSNRVDMWNDLEFFAKDDADAYRAGAAVLRAERDSLRKKCDKKPDGKWHGTITYGWASLDVGQATIKKGQDIVWPQATGWQRWGDQKSKRVRASITADSLDGPIKLVYTANFEWNSYDKGHLEYLDGECGWYRKTDFFHDSGQEKHYTHDLTGTADAYLKSDGRTVHFSIQTDRLSGKYTERNWDYRTGHCNAKLDKRVNRVHTDPDPGEIIGFQLEGAVDPAHPNEIDITKMVQGNDGKERTYYELRLRRGEP